MIKTFQFRVKDSTTAKHLAAHARTVNWIWNFCNDTQKHALKWNKRWPTGFDLSNLCAGSSREPFNYPQLWRKPSTFTRIA
jgi:hypothetical protein